MFNVCLLFHKEILSVLVDAWVCLQNTKQCAGDIICDTSVNITLLCFEALHAGINCPEITGC